MTLQEKDHAYLWHPYQAHTNAPSNRVIVRGSGSLLFDESGASYIDAISSWWVNLHGHAHPALSAALARQSAQLEHVIFARHTHPPAIALAEQLLALFPGMQKVFYSDNGSTAVEVALKMSLQYHQHRGEDRKIFVALGDAYHGDTFGAMSVSARSMFTQAFDRQLFDIIALPSVEDEKQLEAAFDAVCARQDIAAFIYEPCIQGSAGMKMYGVGLLDRLLQKAQANGILLIADEVMTGFGRSETLFVSDQLHTSPDMVCLSKGITGGTMPFGATLATSAMYSAFAFTSMDKTFFHGHSYTGNPLACAVALVSLKLLLDPQCFAQREMIARLHQQFVDTLQDQPQATRIRHKGTIVAWDVDSAEKGYGSPLREKAIPYYAERGILIRPLGETMYILPPYCITEQELTHVYDTTISFLQDL